MKKKNPYDPTLIETIKCIKFYFLLLQINDSTIRISLFNRATRNLKFNDSNESDYFIVSKEKLLKALKLNLIHVTERSLKNQIEQFPQDIFFDIQIPDDWREHRPLQRVED